MLRYNSKDMRCSPARQMDQPDDSLNDGIGAGGVNQDLHHYEIHTKRRLRVSSGAILSFSLSLIPRTNVTCPFQSMSNMR